MNQAQQVIAALKAGAKRSDALAAAPIKQWGRFEGYTSYYMTDGSRVWTHGQDAGACPADDGAPKEANLRPYPQPFEKGRA